MPGEILLIDDDGFISHFLELFLRKKGLSLTAVQSGEEGLERLAEREFGLVLLDLDLAESSALEILRCIHERGSPPAVIVITADSDRDPDCVEALRLGAAGVLKKPFDLQSAYEGICRLLRVTPSPAGRLTAKRMDSRQAELLVIDDDPFIGSLLQEAGRKQNWIVNVARSGEAGLSLLEERGIDLVLLDLSLPEMSGLEVLERMNDSGSVLPVIVITGQSKTDPDCENARRLGAACVLSKPFTVQEFYDTVDSFLARLPSGACRA